MKGKPLIVVLGASGYVGSAITAQLVLRPIRLRVVARGKTVVPDGGIAEVDVRIADLTEISAMADVVSGADVVIHLVLYTEGKTWRAANCVVGSEQVNVGTVKDLIHVLSAPGRIGAPPVVLLAGSTSQANNDAVSAYDRQKIAAERALFDATAAGVVRGISLRLSTVFGNSSHTAVTDRGVVSAMTRRALAGKPLTMWHDGSVVRDLIHVDDVARAFVVAIDHTDLLAGRYWSIGSGHSVRIGNLFTEIAEAVAARTGTTPVPVRCVAPPPEATEADRRSTPVDNSAFRSATHWVPQVPLRDGLAQLVTALASGRQAPENRLAWRRGS